MEISLHAAEFEQAIHLSKEQGIHILLINFHRPSQGMAVRN